MMTRLHRRTVDLLTLHAILIVLTAAVMLPVAFMFFGSFKPLPEIFRSPPRLFPVAPTIQNYIDAARSAPFGIFIWNSVYVGILTTLGAIVVAIPAAYSFSHIKPWGGKFVFMLILSGMMIPPQATIIPRYFIIQNLGWINTYQALVVPFLARPIGIFLLYQFFRTVPKDFEDSARIDGCGPFRYMARILVPLSRPAIGALAILTFVESWNRYMWPLIIATTRRMQTAPIGIRTFIVGSEGSYFGMMMAGAVIVIFPAIMIFILGQKQFVGALARGGIKG